MVEATSSWISDLGKLRRCTGHGPAAAKTHLDPAAAIVTCMP